jgi:large subunit ribosomal protein L21
MSNYAIIETGSKQYRVEPKSVIEVEKLDLTEGQKEVTLDRVLLVRKGDDVQVGTPHVKGATVICDYVGATQGKKVINFRFRRRKNSRRKIGHRQQFSKLVVKEIRTGK